MTSRTPRAAPTPPAALEAASDPAFAAFEEMLRASFPDKRVRRCPMPDGVAQVAVIWIRELDSDDELQAAELADLFATDTQRRKPRLMMQLEQREAKRVSICAIQRRGQAPELITHGVPFVEINKWPQGFWAALELHYLDLNGLPPEELGKSLAGAAVLGATLPPPPIPPSPGKARPAGA